MIFLSYPYVCREIVNTLNDPDRRVNWLSYGIACEKRPSIRYYAPLGSNQGALWAAIGTGQAAIQTGVMGDVRFDYGGYPSGRSPP